MGDADDSYDFADLDAFVDKLRDGHDLVMGNRFQGGIAPGAMPPLHRYLGNPVLTRHRPALLPQPESATSTAACAASTATRSARSTCARPGMEFASEMVVKATLDGLRIGEVPTTLSPDGRSRAAAPAQLARRLAPPALPADALARAGSSCTRASRSRCSAR